MKFLLRLFGSKPPEPSLPGACPECEAQLVQGKDAFRCPQCQGFWLPEFLLRVLLEEQDQQVRELLESPPPGEHTFGPSASPRKCAVCGLGMDNYEFSGVWLDACPRGHGIWLDAGEFRLLKKPDLATAAPASEGDPYRSAFLKTVIQAAEKG